MRTHIINFFVWWYLVKFKQLLFKAMQRTVFMLNYTNTLPMAQNLGKPLYRDRSLAGRFMGLLIRGSWTWLGGMLSLVLVIPRFLFTITFALLPVAAFVFFITNVALLFL